MTSGGWTPGWRRRPPGVKGKFSKNLFALGNIGDFQLYIFKNPPEKVESDLQDEIPLESGENVHFVLNNPRGAKVISINLCYYTEEELRLLVHAFNVAVLEALPIVQERDRLAKEAASNGDDIVLRLYRGTPRFSLTTRPVGPNNPSVQDGPEDVLEGDGTDGDQPS